ncbi:MAG: FAD-binding protein [Hyphomicrobiaceae bacterium]|nr:FAD-binding protein [Hyphomicrobiaceae bacterium]MCC0007873.1 FAD-binding protein [Hyphomicrobiaceae bacterium]
MSIGVQRSVDTVIDILKQRLASRVETGMELRRQHANTVTWLDNEPPDAVVFGQSSEEVALVVQVAGEYRVPVIAFGGGTSLEGQVNAPRGGISLDLSRMTRIVAVHADDLDATVEAGVTRVQLNQYLRDTGLFFPVDPGAETATFGGMAATRASGTNAMRYGTMRDNVVSVTAVMADGRVLRTGGRARKSSAGYDLTRLLVGSEGTLGIITELTVRLYGIPEVTIVAVAPFARVADAATTTMQAMQLGGLGLARIELLDRLQIEAVNTYSKLALACTPTLFVEFHGTAAGLADQVETFREIADGNGALGFVTAASEEERRRLWKARHDAYWATRAAWPGRLALATDVCVPISRLAECIAETEADIERFGLISPIVGHVGDGNFHATPVIDPHDAAERQALEEFLARLAARAIAMEGTCTGEHGIGQGKMRYLEKEFGAEGLDAMRALKAAFDPHGILNPGKIVA